MNIYISIYLTYINLYIYIAWLFHGMSTVPLRDFPTEVPSPRLLPRSSCSKDDGVSGAQRMVPRILVEMWISGLNGNIVAIVWTYIYIIKYNIIYI